MSRPARIHCIHTAAVHEATFARLFAELAPDVVLEQFVKPDWLAHARAHGLDAALSEEVKQTLAVASGDADAVLLTCSTLGPLADSKHSGRVVRIDTPLMRRAAVHDGTVLLTLCLESTHAATIAIFEQACAEAGRKPAFRVAVCSEAWAWFEAGDTQRFAGSIADTIRRSVAAEGRPSCIVLAQASMAITEQSLADLGIPVYSSPTLAVVETLRVAEQQSRETFACA